LASIPVERDKQAQATRVHEGQLAQIQHDLRPSPGAKLIYGGLQRVHAREVQLTAGDDEPPAAIRPELNCESVVVYGSDGGLLAHVGIGVILTTALRPAPTRPDRQTKSTSAAVTLFRYRRHRHSRPFGTAWGDERADDDPHGAPESGMAGDGPRHTSA
jgi:hypothetical protein